MYRNRQGWIRPRRFRSTFRALSGVGTQRTPSTVNRRSAWAEVLIPKNDVPQLGTPLAGIWIRQCVVRPTTKQGPRPRAGEDAVKAREVGEVHNAVGVHVAEAAGGVAAGAKFDMPGLGPGMPPGRWGGEVG